MVHQLAMPRSEPASRHHLYEIRTAPQPPLVTAVLSAEHVHELARLRISLGLKYPLGI